MEDEEYANWLEVSDEIFDAIQDVMIEYNLGVKQTIGMLGHTLTSMFLLEEERDKRQEALDDFIRRLTGSVMSSDHEVHDG